MFDFEGRVGDQEGQPFKSDDRYMGKVTSEERGSRAESNKGRNRPTSKLSKD